MPKPPAPARAEPAAQRRHSAAATRVAVLGAGAVGLSLGTRLAHAGSDVLFLVRRDGVARRIERDGTRVEQAPGGDVTVAQPRASTLRAATAAALEQRIVLVCTRAEDTAETARTLAAIRSDLVVASAQNDVDNEEQLAHHFAGVLGVVVRQTCTRTGPNATRALGAGRLVVGVHPATRTRAAAGANAAKEALARSFRGAGFDVGVSDDIVSDKWLKLCSNLMSVPNALIDPAEHTSRDFVEIKARLLEEARDVLNAAGIDARSCDGRDRSLEEDIEFQRASLARGTSARRLPIYNAVWAALRDGSPLEADRYHHRILALAEAHGLDAPMHARALGLGLRAWRESLGPESLRCADFLESSS